MDSWPAKAATFWMATPWSIRLLQKVWRRQWADTSLSSRTLKYLQAVDESPWRLIACLHEWQTGGLFLDSPGASIHSYRIWWDLVHWDHTPLTALSGGDSDAPVTFITAATSRSLTSLIRRPAFSMNIKMARFLARFHSFFSDSMACWPWQLLSGPANGEPRLILEYPLNFDFRATSTVAKPWSMRNDQYTFSAEIRLFMVVGCSLSLTCMCCLQSWMSRAVIWAGSKSSFTLSVYHFSKNRTESNVFVNGERTFPFLLKPDFEMVEVIHPGHLSRIVFCKVFFISIITYSVKYSPYFRRDNVDRIHIL